MSLGSPLFPQRCQYRLTLVETLGHPENELLSEGLDTQLYFKFMEHTWTLKLYPDMDSDDSKLFVSLLMKMLHLNPQKRISPSNALQQSFLNLSKEDNSDCSSHDMVSAPSVSSATAASSSDDTVLLPDEASESSASDEATVSADAAASSSGDMVSPPDEASESSAVLDTETTSAKEDPAESPEADQNEAAVTSSSPITVQTDLNYAVSADQGPAETPTTAELNDEVVAEAPDT